MEGFGLVPWRGELGSFRREMDGKHEKGVLLK